MPSNSHRDGAVGNSTTMKSAVTHLHSSIPTLFQEMPEEPTSVSRKPSAQKNSVPSPHRKEKVEATDQHHKNHKKKHESQSRDRSPDLFTDSKPVWRWNGKHAQHHIISEQ